MLPAISLPSATLRSFPPLFLNSFDEIISLNVTVERLLLGTSMPTAALFGIGASILTPVEARPRAISSERFVILLIFTPGAGESSYLVTEGPREAPISLVSTPKLISTSTSFLAVACISSVKSALFSNLG